MCTRATLAVWLVTRVTQVTRVDIPKTLSSAFIFNWIFFILAGIEDRHESLDEFEYRQICNRVTAFD